MRSPWGAFVSTGSTVAAILIGPPGAHAQTMFTQGRVILSADGRDAPGYISAPYASGPNGSFFALDAMDAQVWAVDSSGRRLWVSGSRGDGPGQFQSAVSGSWRRDSVIIVDRNLRRATVFNAKTGRFVTSWPAPTADALRIQTGDVRAWIAISRDCWVIEKRVPEQQKVNGQTVIVPRTVVLLARRVRDAWKLDSLFSYSDAQLTVTAHVPPVWLPAPVVTATIPVVAQTSNGLGVVTIVPRWSPQTGVELQTRATCDASPTRQFVPITEQPLTRDVVERMYVSILEDRLPPGSDGPAEARKVMELVARQGGRGLVQPLFSGSAIGPDDAVWLEVIGSASISRYHTARRWLRADQTGRVTETFTVPSDMRVALITITGPIVLQWKEGTQRLVRLAIQTPKVRKQ